MKNAAAIATEKGQPVSLVRADGSASGLIVTPEGELRRAALKPQGKAARKEFKKLNRLRRRLVEAGHDSSANVVTKRMQNLCLPR